MIFAYIALIAMDINFNFVKKLKYKKTASKGKKIFTK